MKNKLRLTWRAATASAAVVLFALSGTTTRAHAASIKLIDYPTFTNGPDLLLRGNATVVTPGASKSKVLRLTRNKDHQTGAAWASAKLSPQKSFDTTFVARIHHNAIHGDGIAFVVQGAGPKALGWDGGGVGYSGIKPSLAVEFDTYKNVYDVDANHVGVATGGNAEATFVSAKSPVQLTGTPFRAKVAYDATAKNLRVWVNSAANAGMGVMVINRTVDLAAAVGVGPANVGFTGATGSNYGIQDVSSWTLTTA